ncbi:AAA family ATPase [Acinetobacter larvae]|uniref:Rad50/SbcC-type AAA domain-containing protein n=1 Tax=Acinetobacter larvae TaxID=1789224 RepID=A0A1B2M1L5_9GAMM|nr:AAA family ATPase [Acinetobacter larvae]AOA59082.1 hypothetical protein BFG52_12460 [Acinetobacter larvae]
MKITSIRIKNLASLAGEQFIDFSCEPLASAGLIAITGKTGAGKSTILDAMCLSLFNRIPRLKDGEGKLIDVDGSELPSNSPLTVLRRGSAHGFAELCFVAPDQKHYLARWEIKRARENPQGKLQNIQRSLRCLSDGILIADKIKAVDEQIQQITQLSFEQFTRAVLLAQSEVTAFLKARDQERGELLEYLTNSNIYAKIGQLAFEKSRDIQLQRKQLEQILGHIERLSPEQIDSLEQQYRECLAEQQQLEQQKQQDIIAQQWYQRQSQLQQNITQKQHDLQQAQQQSQALAAERLQLQRLQLFSQIRPLAYRHQQDLAQQQHLEQQLQQQQPKFLQIEQQFTQIQQQFQQLEQQQQQQQQFEQQYQPQLLLIRQALQEREFLKKQYKELHYKIEQAQQQHSPLVEHNQQLQQQQQALQQNLAQLQQTLDSSQHFAALDSGISVHIQQFQHYIKQYRPIAAQIGSMQQAQQQLGQCLEQISQYQQQHGDVDAIDQQLEQLQQQRENLQLKITTLQHLQQQYSQQHAVQQRCDALQLEQQQQQQALTQQQAQQQQAEQDYQASKAERLQLQHFLHKQRLLFTESVEKLRAQLLPEQPCIVCGSTEHPYLDPQQQPNKMLLALEQQQLQQAEQQEQQHLQHWQQAQQQAARLDSLLQQLQQQIHALSQQAEQLQHDIAQHMQIAQLPACPTTLSMAEHLKAVIATQQTLLHSSEQQRQQFHTAKQQLQTLHSQSAQQQQQIERAQHLQAQIELSLSSLDNTTEKQALDFSIPHIKKLCQQLQQRQQQLQQYSQCEQQLQSLQRELQHSQQRCQHSTENIQQLEQQRQDITTQGRQKAEYADQELAQITAITAVKASEWMQQHEQQQQQLQQDYAALKPRYEQLQQEYLTQKQQRDQEQHQLQQLQQSLEQLEQQLQHWCESQQDFTLAQFPALLTIDSHQEQQIREHIQHVEGQYNEIQAVHASLQEQLQLHQQTQPPHTLTHVLERLEHTATALQQQQQHKEQLKLQLDLERRNQEKQQQYQSQITEIQQQEYRWSKISNLMGDKNGKKFRDYAQQYHLDMLLIYANQQLQQLSQRYTLKRLDHSLSLAIIDHEMDGEVRAVASLSGGESFLTALALSLAIANMASGSLKIESLFIDEGFGTLDHASLHMVMNALDHLQSQGRKVILISHIAEMHERIPVQIQVNPIGAGASKIDIVG